MGGRTCVAVIGTNCVNCRIKCYNNYGNLATAYCDRSGAAVRVKASVISIHCLIGVSSLLCLSVRLAIAISAFRCARLPLLHQYQSTRVSGGVPTEMQLGLLSPLYLRKLFELMGTTYIKLGQFIASAPTFSQPEYVRRFSEPFNKAPPVPFEEVHKNLQEELGRPRDSVYKYVDPTQLASASITQVHEPWRKA
ncbi:hypothetical protein IGI04_032274 [Brassica rapa subsp. trilocularis]|uniref:ABC1 atypical kinase-like domain-containing protein n=1 Tax=Brassica rapa subsp. trilocularis TaxID=1813537 RepID=A0ABQ7LYI3_BRACM|nr:hypothetical protein IGI04_032274 [Brassica rapa subsp. trilocularis]